MGIQVFKEPMTGKYNGVIPPTLLKPGDLSGGENIRKISPSGGWKTRKGVTAHNSTVIAAASVLSLHRYKNPLSLDYHFLAQCNAKIYDATNDPPADGTTFGTDITNGTTVSTTKPGFSDIVREMLIYADGGVPLSWGGDTPLCSGFLCYDNSETEYVDFTRDVTDNRADTGAVALAAASDVWYVCSPEIAKAITFTLGTDKNVTAARTLTLNSWQSGAWSDRTETDGTAGTTTMDQSGSITWTASASDEMSVIGGIMGYWYQIVFSDALSNSIDIVSITVEFDLAELTNKWDGVFEYPLAVRHYEVNNKQYIDKSGSLLNESTSQYLQLEALGVTDFIYVKTKDPITGIGFGVVAGYAAEDDSQITAADGVQHWDGDSWVNNAITSDETLDGDAATSFAQTGTVWWNAAGTTVKRRTLPGDSLPGYWYRVSWDAAIGNAATDVRIYLVTTVSYPDTLGSYDGVIEFKNRAFLWGDKEFPNRLRYSAYDRADCFAGSDSGYTDAVGGMDKILAVKRFYNELIIFKENSVWLLEGYNGATFGLTKIADTVGIIAVKTAEVVETGFPGMHTDEVLSIAIWVDVDGVYVLDGRKPRKVSLPIDHYFNIEYSTAIEAAKLDDLQSFVDPLNNEYHLLIPYSGTQDEAELVYNYITDEWYPPWSRTVGGANDYLVCGISLKGTDDRYYTYGGGSAGRVYLLEDDTSDKDASDADVAISCSMKTRGISKEQESSPTLEFTLRHLWLEGKAITAPATKTITTKVFKDLASSGTELAIPSAIALENSGYSIALGGLDCNIIDCKTVQIEFATARIDMEMSLYSFMYALDIGRIVDR